MSIYLRTEPILPEWTDYNGHMNLAFYIHLFDQGWDVLLDKFQMGGDSAKIEKRSTFAVESHTKYIKEVKQGDNVDINLLFLDRDSKKNDLSVRNFVNCNYLAATTEVCSLYVNLETRRATEIESRKLDLIDNFIDKNKINYEPIEFYLIDKLKKRLIIKSLNLIYKLVAGLNIEFIFVDFIISSIIVLQNYNLMKNKIKIDNKYIGTDQPMYFIAEAGVNHNNSLEKPVS